MLRKAPPSVVRQWATGNAVPIEDRQHPSVITDSGPGGGSAAPANRTTSWLTAALIQRVGPVVTTQGGNPREDRLLVPDVGGVHPILEGSNETQLVQLGNGESGFHKPFAGVSVGTASSYGQEFHHPPLHEVASWRVARAMGEPWSSIVPTTVLREARGQDLGSFSAAMSGAEGSQHRDLHEAAAVFDALVGQQDRHSMNYLNDPTGGPGLALIDHGFTFARPGDFCNASDFIDSRVSPDLTVHERQGIQRLMSDPDLGGIAAFLDQDRADALRRRATAMLQTNQVRREF